SSRPRGFDREGWCRSFGVRAGGHEGARGRGPLGDVRDRDRRDGRGVGAARGEERGQTCARQACSETEICVRTHCQIAVGGSANPRDEATLAPGPEARDREAVEKSPRGNSAIEKAVNGCPSGAETGDQSSQFSTFRPCTRLNSVTFAVTQTARSVRACAAMSRSFAPIGVPKFSRAARISA